MVGTIKTQPRGLKWDGYADKRQAVRRERRNPVGGQCLEWMGLKIACCRADKQTKHDGRWNKSRKKIGRLPESK